MFDRSPALWRRPLAALIDSALTVAVMVAVMRAAGLGSSDEEAAPELPPDLAESFSWKAMLTISRFSLVNAAAQPLMAERILRMWPGFLAFGLVVPATMVWTHGQTPGKALLGLRVVCSDGQPIGATRAILRALGPDRLIAPTLRMLQPSARVYIKAALATLDPAWVLLNQEHRSLSDVLAGTRVVKA